MTEWGVVTVLIAVVGLAVTVGKPIITLNSTITKLNVLVDGIKSDVESLTAKNSESHARIWEHNEKQDAKLDDHERRIIVLEK
jgi:hypothetical protein